jgi:hypothetical protein
MRYLKMIGLATLAAMAITAILGAGTASATQLYKYTTPNANDSLGIGTEIEATLESGTSALFKDTSGNTVDTCTGSSLKVQIEKDTTNGVNPQGKPSILTLSGCTESTLVGGKGELEIKNIAGTTNATVISRGAVVTIPSTFLGISCTVTTGTGTSLGTLTGAKSSVGQATLDINAVLALDPAFCGDLTWTGSYAITSPVGLTVEAS